MHLHKLKGLWSLLEKEYNDLDLLLRKQTRFTSKLKQLISKPAAIFADFGNIGLAGECDERLAWQSKDFC